MLQDYNILKESTLHLLLRGQYVVRQYQFFLIADRSSQLTFFYFSSDAWDLCNCSMQVSIEMPDFTVQEMTFSLANPESVLELDQVRQTIAVLSGIPVAAQVSHPTSIV